MKKKKIAVIGTGIGGLSAALKLAHRGCQVTVFERHEMPGGKIRVVPSDAGPIDAGPTVFTLLPFFESLFNGVNEKLYDHLELVAEPIVAKHFWRDGSSLKLYSNIESNLIAIREFAGTRGLKEFNKFSKLACDLFSTFDKSLMQNPNPNFVRLMSRTLPNLPNIMPALIPFRSLDNLLNKCFSDKRLRQLFGRYATYVGGSPFECPAILSLIWQAESQGVWRVKGGMHQIPKTIQSLAKKKGAEFKFNTEVSEIITNNKKVCAIKLKSGQEIDFDLIVFNGDPKALYDGLLGTNLSELVSTSSVAPRSLSAYVWSFAAKTTKDPKLEHHNVFFNEDYRSEFKDIKKNIIPKDPVLYLCAEDRGLNQISKGFERFEIIMNAAPYKNGNKKSYNIKEEFDLCQKTTFKILKKMNLTFDPMPGEAALTTPKIFHEMFPSSNGSLYGLSPKNIWATFRRPQSRTSMKGLYLAGGGVHPGPGIPMALLSGQHAAEMILKDHFSI